ncbi:MAG TPA: oxygenase MpaB family protein [Solirubrobacteraceae bacterium]|jgi:uncharacterized protein (DUF2236 family)
MNNGLYPDDIEVEELLVGPDSVTWRYASDARLHLTSLYALLLQVAHPTVGAGVHDYSNFEARPWDRLMRTLDYVNLLVYGGREAAAAGRRLRELHKGFRGVRADGERYHALEPDAYAWVHATLISAYVHGHAQFGRPMSRDDRERFYREYRGLGRLIGVRERDLPDDWAGFERYFARVCATELVRTESVGRVLRSIGRAAPPPMPIPIPIAVWRTARVPISRALWLGGVGLIEPELRRRLGIRFTRLDEAAFHTLGALSRATEPALPQRLKVMGPAHLRWRGAEIATGPLGPSATTIAAAA